MNVIRGSGRSRKDGPVFAPTGNPGKGDRPRPTVVADEQLAENGKRTFRPDWDVPNVIRRKRELAALEAQQQAEAAD